MEPEISRIKKTQPLAKRPNREDDPKNASYTEKPNGFNSRNFTDKQQSRTKAQENSNQERISNGDGTSANRPETSVGRSRNVPLSRGSSSNNVTSGPGKGPALDYIPVIVCDEVSEGDTPVQSCGADVGVTSDNNFLLQTQEPDLIAFDTNEVLKSSNAEVAVRTPIPEQPKQILITEEATERSRSEAVSRRNVSASKEQDRGPTSPRSRRSSAYGQGSPKRQGESYVERLAKSRARCSPSLNSANTSKDAEERINNLTQISKEHNSKDEPSWNDIAYAEDPSHFHAALAKFVSEDLRQSPQRSMSFASTPLSMAGSRTKIKTYQSQVEHLEVNDHDFDSDGEDKKLAECSKLSVSN
ncbi:hypothetical protein PoB_000830700 [Plakobranchus ocellatus]|uniref:Uncharacterized protein n=1 Tax=Plakobranchus ocellatus TaxID=259542 RepID=A0AAV3YHX3_9GAST|nr:hypothetical protein PoB_000830700 [Plakobranchus ocellatus]